jgi:fucose 4-O-acetylase-like acetyltransferase
MVSHPVSRLSLFIYHTLQYIGTRTLDIYLLHYFVLPRFLILHSEPLRAYDCKLLEFITALSIALVVVGICLIVSYVIRLSPFLGHYLFGVKYEKRK